MGALDHPPTIRAEIGPTLKLAIPIMLGMLGYGLMFVVDVAMAGHLGETALAALDAKRYKGEIEAELVAALAIDPATELDRVMQARAEALLDIMGSKKPGEIEKTAQGML